MLSKENSESAEGAGSFLEKKIRINEKTQKKIFKLAIFFLIIHLLRIYQPAIYDQIDRWKLIPRNEYFTEIYLNNHMEIFQERDAIKAKEPFLFSFTIHNLEGRDKEYFYIVYAKDAFGEKVISRNAVFVKNNEYKVIKESYLFKKNQPKETIFMKLIEQEQEIHFSLATKY